MKNIRKPNGNLRSSDPFLVSDCRFGVSPVNYPDPDPAVTKISLMIQVSESNASWFRSIGREAKKYICVSGFSSENN